MNGVTHTLNALHHGEKRLADRLTTTAERHSAEHEVHHVATDLARWSREHAQRLAQAAQDRDTELMPDPDPDTDDLPAWTTDGHPEPGLLLLHELRELHLAATENSLLWEMLAQVAQATSDDELLTLASSCHPQTLRQMRWTNTMIKTLSPQILSSL
ncbi:hypothetical protein PV396_40680 [Streptomyces sp. ME02-8801-2C]|uniref:hypothetical protein n=1 Tax=Streptomyces sp. ME02-8801-2C TaxID=3028680 RepID=UPI0029A3A007|nr:hypothetical protein [Streptomyces sp. ME02-8801-2C]MDX3458184.1 hypothetical protein [Streptomyces sp. ME02-8801-2C]